MAPILPRSDIGLVKSNEAISEKVAKRLGHMYDEIMGVVNKTSILPELVKEYQMSEEDGLEMTIYDTTQNVAYRKPEGSETDQQKPEVEEITKIRLEQWETRIGLTDEAKIDSGEVNMTASERQQAGKSGVAFRNAIDAEGLGAVYAGRTPVAATAAWNDAPDNTISNDISTAVDIIEMAGFAPDKIVLTRQQYNRISDTNWVIQGRTVEEYLMMKFGLKPILARRVTYKDMSGAPVWLFNPTGQLVILDSSQTALFCQKPMTVEMDRVVARGLDESFWRKFFRTKVIEDEAMFVYNGIGY